VRIFHRRRAAEPTPSEAGTASPTAEGADASVVPDERLLPPAPTVVTRPSLPIIYVRGYAGGQSGINAAVDDPFYGFNEGSTHIRVGTAGQPRYYQYEGPLLRLLLQRGYHLEVAGSQSRVLTGADDGALEPASVWIYRFYDESADTFGENPEGYDITKAAKGLADLITLVRQKTEGSPKVNLLAHSMGGLVCRTALQTQIENPEQSVSKLCTLATPHGGIDPTLGGDVGDWFIKTFGPNGSQIFSPEVMKSYMLPPGYDASEDVDRGKKWDPRISVGFSKERILSVVGTDPHDYIVAMGLSSLSMGPQSDGLVAIRNAYVFGSARAYVHRTHSGRYGIVNSEEAFQSLDRFFFGATRVDVSFHGLDGALMGNRVWQADVRLAIRGVPVLISEQTAEHHCPVDLVQEATGAPGPLAPVPLVTTWLMPREDGNPSRYALQLKVISLDESDGVFGFGAHLEQIGDWADSVIVDVSVNKDGSPQGVRWQWNSTIDGRIAEAVTLSNELGPDGTILLPDSARRMLGEEARLVLTASAWE